MFYNDDDCGELFSFWHLFMSKFANWSKVIYPKYSKHWPYTVAHTIDCVCDRYRGPNIIIFRISKVPLDGSTCKKMILIFFLCLCIRKYLKRYKEVSYRLRKKSLWFKSMNFCNHWLETSCLFHFKRGDPNFF